MNTRLQVEHPVTELVTGRDLVADQLRDRRRRAARASTRRRSTAGWPTGHAIEVRLYAEDAEDGFLPATGRVEALAWPTGRRHPGRCRDRRSGPRSATGSTRCSPRSSPRAGPGGGARAASTAALDETVVLGLTTNLRFLRWLVRQPVVRSRRGADRHARPDLAARRLGRADAIPDAAWATAAGARRAAASRRATARPARPIHGRGGWRLNGRADDPPRGGRHERRRTRRCPADGRRRLERGRGRRRRHPSTSTSPVGASRSASRRRRTSIAPREPRPPRRAARRPSSSRRCPARPGGPRRGRRDRSRRAIRRHPRGDEDGARRGRAGRGHVAELASAPATRSRRAASILAPDRIDRCGTPARYAPARTDRRSRRPRPLPTDPRRAARAPCRDARRRRAAAPLGSEEYRGRRRGDRADRGPRSPGSSGRWTRRAAERGPAEAQAAGSTGTSGSTRSARATGSRTRRRRSRREAKPRFIELLAAAGLREIEATSFVAPAADPAARRRRRAPAALPRATGVRYPVLVPNLRGLEPGGGRRRRCASPSSPRRPTPSPSATSG